MADRVAIPIKGSAESLNLATAAMFVCGSHRNESVVGSTAFHAFLCGMSEFLLW